MDYLCLAIAIFTVASVRAGMLNGTLQLQCEPKPNVPNDAWGRLESRLYEHMLMSTPYSTNKDHLNNGKPFLIANLEAPFAGLFECVVVISEQEKCSISLFIISSNHSFVGEVSPQSVDKGETAILTCGNYSGDSTQFTWERYDSGNYRPIGENVIITEVNSTLISNNETLNNKTETEVDVRSNSSKYSLNGTSLLISNVVTADEGLYRCAIQNSSYQHFVYLSINPFLGSRWLQWWTPIVLCVGGILFILLVIGIIFLCHYCYSNDKLCCHRDQASVRVFELAEYRSVPGNSRHSRNGWR